MKTYCFRRRWLLLLLAIVLAVLVPFVAMAQEDHLVCGTKFDPKVSGSYGSLSLSQYGGIYLTASGTVKVLLVFVSYPEDESAHPYWPAHQPPTNMNQYIDSTSSESSTNFSNLTNYFRQMSLGAYTVIGKAIFVNAPHTQAWYSQYGYDRGATNKDVLQYAVNPIVNFAEYDNWTRTANYQHTNQPDNIVDMIVMSWRGMQWGYLGEASMGGGSDLSADGKVIKFSYPVGSGIFCSYPSSRWPEKHLQTMAHEMGHWLLGQPHPYSDIDGIYAPWSLLGLQFSAGVCVNTYERERLGWINPTVVTEANCPLADYITTGVAYKHHPPNGAANEYLYFENHQKLSVYDDATANASDQGIWVIHQLEPYSGSNNIRIKPADGFYNWTNPGTTSLCFSQTLPYLKKQAANRNASALSARDEIPVTGGRSWVSVYQDEYNALHCGAYNRGEGTFGAFNLSYSSVFSRWSNPSANCWNDAVDDLSMQVTVQNGSVVTVHFYVGGTAISSAPSKPLFLRASPNPGNNHVLLTWAANIESDLSLYDVWRKDANTGNIWQSIGTSTTASYVDNDYYLPGSDFLVLYKVRAKDTQSIYSSFSDSIQARCEWLHKEILTSDLKVHSKDYSLVQNYPNPFNPTTTINFELPEREYVVLAIYDVLGREVAMLVNGYQEGGNNSIRWNASSVSSGVYYLRIVATNDLGKVLYTKTNKLLLMK